MASLDFSIPSGSAKCAHELGALCKPREQPHCFHASRDHRLGPGSRRTAQRCPAPATVPARGWRTGQRIPRNVRDSATRSQLAGGDHSLGSSRASVVSPAPNASSRVPAALAMGRCRLAIVEARVLRQLAVNREALGGQFDPVREGGARRHLPFLECRGRCVDEFGRHHAVWQCAGRRNRRVDIGFRIDAAWPDRGQGLEAEVR